MVVRTTALRQSRESCLSLIVRRHNSNDIYSITRPTAF
jgi:hypothetical protein